jgi:hypothetical protein
MISLKVRLAAAALVPVILGYILNMTLIVPFVGSIVYYILPLLTLVLWFWIGSKYGQTNWNILQSILIGNLVGFISLGLYLWQFTVLNDDKRDLFIAGFSQMFTACTNIFTVRIAILFEAEQNAITQTSATALQYLGLILMVVVFAFGYVYGKRKSQNN